MYLLAFSKCGEYESCVWVTVYECCQECIMKGREAPTNNCILDCTTIVGVNSLHIKLLGM